MFLNTDAKYIWLNGAFQPFNDTNIHLLSHTLHYGLGAFEGVRAYETETGGAIFRLRDHTERLFDAADKINITIPYSIEELEAVQKEAMTKNNLKEGYIRPIVFLGSESMGLRAKDLVSVNVAVACWEWPSYMDPEAKKKGISVIKSPYQQYDNPLYSNNKIIGTYINSIMALHDALAKNADEAILLDKNGFISEGSGENLFIVKDSKLLTPKIDFCLNGITRQSVITMAQNLGVEVEEKDLTKVNYEILPHLNKEIKEFCKLNKIKKLKDVPSNLLETNRKGFVNGYHKIIQKCHIDNEPWINVKVKDVFKEFKWPFYFLDFETVMQTVPIIKDTRPNDRLPFQWSVHKWTNIDEEIKIDEGSSFLKFDNQDIENEFLISLIKILEDKGTIFVHNASFEVSLLNSLKIKTKFKKYSKDIDNIISRVADTLTIVRENFYSPLMKGKYSLKNIVKSIPTSVDYNEEDEIEGGMGAQLAWFLYTDPKSSKKDKNLQEDKLTTYCAKDTYALYDLVKYFMK